MRANPSDQQGLLAVDVAKRLSVGVQTLHFYEREGLLNDVPRTRAGYRVYPEALVERVRFIKQAQALGLPLAEVKQILSLAERGASPCGRVQEALAEKLVNVNQRLVELRRFRQDLARLIDNAPQDYATRGNARVCAIVENAEPLRPPAADSERLTKLRPAGKSRS